MNHWITALYCIHMHVNGTKNSADMFCNSVHPWDSAYASPLQCPWKRPTFFSLARHCMSQKNTNRCLANLKVCLSHRGSKWPIQGERHFANSILRSVLTSICLGRLWQKKYFTNAISFHDISCLCKANWNPTESVPSPRTRLRSHHLLSRQLRRTSCVYEQ